MRGSASPKGEARRECAAKRERNEARGREDYGWGWAGGVTKLALVASPAIPANIATGSSIKTTQRGNVRRIAMFRKFRREEMERKECAEKWVFCLQSTPTSFTNVNRCIYPRGMRKSP